MPMQGLLVSPSASLGCRGTIRALLVPWWGLLAAALCPMQGALCGESDTEASPALIALVACIASGPDSDNDDGNKSSRRSLQDSATAINMLWAAVKGDCTWPHER